jgi:class 3 adenylate cyclase
MPDYSRTAFATTVRSDFSRRRSAKGVFEGSMRASAGLETKALGHPEYESLDMGDRKTAPMVCVFLDLSNFTARTFWDNQDEVVDLAHAVLSGFIEAVTLFGGHPLGLRGDGLFAGFSPGAPDVTAAMALAACTFVLDGVENEVNPWLDQLGIARVQARAGLDYGQTTFVRSGSREHSEINPLGFAANFAAKCEKKAKSWEIVTGAGLRELLPAHPHFVEHPDSPKEYDRNYERKFYKFFDFRWRRTVPLLPGLLPQLDGTPTSRIAVS